MEMEDCKWLVLVVLLSLTEDGCRGDSPRPEVKTSLGVLRGVSMVSRGGREYALFTRIPYAEPPLGKLRFIVSAHYFVVGMQCHESRDEDNATMME